MVPMFLQRYVHMVLDAVLGSYVKNIDPDALKISVWNGKIEVDAVELQPDAFPLPKEFALVKGTLHQLRIDMPWTNLASQPIRVDIEDMSLLLQVRDTKAAAASDSDLGDPDAPPVSADALKKRQETLRRKRATMDAIERATQFNERNVALVQGQSWTHSFFFKLLVKVLDNVQLHVQHLHLRLEDRVSDPAQPYAVGVTLESLIIKSADAGWNYTMVVRGQSSGTDDSSNGSGATATILRKKMDINKFGVYWSLPLAPVPAAVLDDSFAFARLMQMSFWSPDAPAMVSKTAFPPLFQPQDYIIHPLTVSMKLTVNDGHAKLPLTHQELSDRVLSRLGTPWMVETIDAIGDTAWREFLAAMPPLARDRKYTLGFVFSEAWAVARDLTDEEDVIPSLEQFQVALASCLQWSRHETTRLAASIAKYRDAVVHIMDEKSTYIDATASVDHVRLTLSRTQYLSALSLASFLTVKRRQARYVSIRPKRVRVKDNPAAWWQYAIRAVLLDVRERLARVDWDALQREKAQRQRYMELYLVLAHSTSYAATRVSADVKALTKDAAAAALDDLEVAMDVKDLLRLRRAARKEVEEREHERQQEEAQAQRQTQQGAGDSRAGATAPPPVSTSLWSSYASWLTGAATGAPTEPSGTSASGTNASDVPVDDVRWSDQDTKDLYDAINFHPQPSSGNGSSSSSNSGKDGASLSPSKGAAQALDESAAAAAATQEQQHIWYRFQLGLTKASFGLYKDTAPVASSDSVARPSDSPDKLRTSSLDLAPLGADELDSSDTGDAIATVNADDGMWSPRPASTCLLLASLDDVAIQVLVRPASLEMGLHVRDAFFCQDPDVRHTGLTSSAGRAHQQQHHRAFFLQRMAMDEVLQYHPEGAREKISSVRLRECERELPLLALSIESRTDVASDDDTSASDTSAAAAAAVVTTRAPALARVLRISLVTQPIKCNVNLMYLLDVSACFSRPLHVDLSGLEQSAWKRAQSLQRYSTAQLREALARRTRVEMQLDVISPLINIVEVHSESDVGPVFDSDVSTQKQVSLLVFLGHLRASTIHPMAAATTDVLPPSPLKLVTESDTSGSVATAAAALVQRQFLTSPVGQNVYDILEFSISGIQVQLFDGNERHNGDDDTAQFWFLGGDRTHAQASSWSYLLEKTSLTFSFHMSVAPDDPTIPLLKLFGGVDSVHVNLSAANFRSVLSLLQSFSENLTTYSKRKVASGAAVAGIATTRTRGSPLLSHIHTAGSDPTATSGVHSFAPTAAREIPPRLVKSASYFASAPMAHRPGGDFASTTAAAGMRGKESVSDSNLYASFAKALDHERERARRKEIEDKDLLKLWKRVMCYLQFGVGEVVLQLQIRDDTSVSEKLVVVRAGDISTRLKMRTFDRRLEFALGTFAVEDIVRSRTSGDASLPSRVVERKRYLMASGSGSDVHPDTGYSEHGGADCETAPPPPPPKSSEQLIRVAITSIASDAELPKDTGLWRYITYDPVVAAASDHSIWQDPLVTPLSVDASLRTLTINLYQDTVAEMFVFFFERDDDPVGIASPELHDDDDHDAVHLRRGEVPIPSMSNYGTATPFDVDDMFPTLSPAAGVGEDDAVGIGGGTLTKKFGAWVASSFLENLPGSGSTPDRLRSNTLREAANRHATGSSETDTTTLDGSPASIQLRLHVDGLSLFLHLEDRQRRNGMASAFMSLTTEKFCCCVHKYPLYLGVFSYLTSLKVSDVSLSEPHFREIISHASSSSANGATAADSVHAEATQSPGHVPSLDETLSKLDAVPAVFSCAAQFYGADRIQEAWHPGYANRFSVRLKSPRMRFLYSFVDDLRRYFAEGELLRTIFAVLFRERADMVWEGDFERAMRHTGGSSSNGHGNGPSSHHGESPLPFKDPRFLGSDVVSMFPLVDVQLTDAVLEMPPHRMSSEALVVRLDRFRVTNEHVLASVREMENRIVAKVLLNASLTQLQLDLSSLRIVSVILMEPSSGDDTDNTRAVAGGYTTQSLLGSTDIHVAVDFRTRAAMKIDVRLSPLRLVCNQKQYAFVLRVPMQNYRERSRYYFAAPTHKPSSVSRLPRDSKGALRIEDKRRSASVFTTAGGGAGGSDAHQSVIYEESESYYSDMDMDDDDDERHVLVSVAIPELSMELLQGHDGYHPSVSGDLCMAERDKTNQGSICVLDVTAYDGRVDYCLSTGQLVVDAEIDGIHIRDSRIHAKLSTPYRDVVVFERGPDGRAKSLALHFVRATEVVDIERIGIDASFLSSSSSLKKSPSTVSPKRMASAAASPSDAYKRARSRSPVRTLSSRALFRFASPAKPPVRRRKESNASVASHKSRSWSAYTGQPSGIGESDSGMGEHHLSESQGSAGPPQIGRETRMDLILDIVGFRVIPSNIYANVLRFLDVSQSWGQDDESTGADAFELSAAGVNGLTEGAANENGDGDHATEDDIHEDDDDESLVLEYRKIGLQVNLGPSALLLVEDPTKDKSRALMLSWDAAISLEFLQQLGDQDVETSPSVKPSQSHNQLQLRTNVNSIHATSRIPDDSIWASAHVFNAATADCLKPIDLELVLHIDLVNQFVRFRSKFDRVMELRFGYLDFCTAVAAIEHIVRSPWDVPETPEAKARKRTSSGSSSSLVSIGGSAGESDGDFGDRSSTASTTAASLRGLSMRGASSSGALHAKAAGDAKGSPALYGQTLIHLVSTSVRGRLQSRPVVGLYNSPWRKRYLVLPYTSQERNMVDAVAFRIVPAPGSRRALGDQVYYGDRIVLEAVMAGASSDNAPAAATTPSRDVRDASPSRSPGFGPLAAAATAASPASLQICKYDQLGANGYLGPDGSAGAFVTTIWKHGSTMFNSDRSVVFDKDLVVLEELTLNRAFNRAKSAAIVRKHLSAAKTKAVADAEQAASASGGEGGGYLMFNGVGDAPVPFALSIVKRDAWSGDANALAATLDDSSEMLEAERDARDRSKRTHVSTPSESGRHAASIAQQLSLLQHLKIIEFTLPGLHATVVNDFHNMLLPLLHFRVAMLHADVRGRFDDKFTALASLRVGVQAYNSQLAVWEPVVEDFDVNMAYHNRGGVLCDFCMSERLEVSPSGSVLRCDGIPKCLFRSSRTEVFADAVAHACEAKHFIDRELLHQTDDQSAKHANTFLLVIKKDLNVNLSRNVLNVLVHFQALVSKAATTDDAALLARLGPFIYVDNQSGIPFLVATHSASGSAPPPSGSTADALNPFSGTETGSFDVPTAVPSSGDSEQTDSALLEAETTAFERSAWSRRRLSTMLNDISSSRTTWLKVPSGERIATDIVAHETPAGSVTSPLRRLLWLKPQSDTRAALAASSSGKAIPVPIGYSNRSYLYLESHNGAQDVWHGESVICETVAEQGTLVLRLRGKVQLTNYLDVPIQVLYNEARVETIAPGAQAAHYIPIQYLERGTISFCPLLRNGELQKSAPLAIRSLLQSDAVAPKKRSQRHQQIGSLELRKALTFYWNAHPESPSTSNSSTSKTALDAMDFTGIPLPPFQLILTATRKSERHETMISLRAPIELENLIPYEVAFRTACLKSDDDVVYVEQHPASFPGTHGTIVSGSCALISELELLSDGFGASDVQDVPSIVALSLAIPEIRLGSYSAWSAQRFVYGCQSFCERLELSMDSSAGTDDADASRATNKLTICVEVTQLEKLRAKALNGLCPVICRIFTEYWLIDRTSLSLSFYTADGYCIPSNHTLAIATDNGAGGDTPDTTPPNVSLSVFSSESKQHVSKMKVGIQTTTVNDEPTEVRSDAFDISAVGVRGQILVPTHHRESRNLLATILERPSSASSLGSSASSFQQFDFGVTIEQGPGKFARSKVVTLVSRYYFVNTSHRFDVHIRQERSAATSDTVIVLAPKASRIFHWTDVRLPSRVQIRFAQPGTSPASTSLTALSQWSSPFALSSVGNFVLQLQKNLTPAPASLPQCYEANAPARAMHGSVGDNDYLVGDGYWPDDDALEAEQMIAGGMQLHVAVELHDPSFFVYLEEGAFESSPSRGLLLSSDVNDADVRYELSREKEKDAFVPYRIQNECSEYALVVWQKIVTKDDRGNAVVGFEGGETVLPFHTIDYVPYTFSSVLTVFVQIQKVAGLKRKHKKGSTRGSSKIRGGGGATPPSSALATDVPTLVLASFEAQLNKLHRLPTLELEDTKARKRLWVEVLLDQATKTLQVTDMLPGVSAEHKRRRRSSLLRSWKRYSASILSISHALASRVPPKPETPVPLGSGAAGAGSATKKKQVRFAEARVSNSRRDGGDGNQDDATGDDDDKEATADQVSRGDSGLEPALDSAAASLSTSPGGVVPAPTPPPGFMLCVKVVDVLHLEELLKKRGRSDFSSSQPFLYVNLRSDASTTTTTTSTSGRSKLVPQHAAVFPRWVPSHESASLLSLTIPDNGIGDDATNAVDSENGNDSGAPAAVVNIQVREPDKLLFGSSLLATVNIPLAAYLRETKRSRQSGSASPLAFPDVHEVLVPIDVVREAGALDTLDEGTRAMVKLQLCCQHVASIASSARALSDVQSALVAFSMAQELEGLVSSKTRLKSLLEGESVDVTTGRDDIVPSREKQSPATLSPSSSSGLTASSVEEHTRRSVNRGGSTLSVTTDDTTSDFGGLEDMNDEKRLTAVLVGVSNLQIPSRLLAASGSSSSALTDGADEPKVYCTITYKESTRSAASSIAKTSPDAATAASGTSADESTGSGSGVSKLPAPLEHVRTHTFARGQALGLDLVYKSGRVLVQGVACDGPCGALLLEGKIRIGDTVVAVNSKPIVNLHREASFSVIERALAPVTSSSGGVDTDAFNVVSLSFLYQPLAQRARLPSASRGRTSSSGSSKHTTGAETSQPRAFDAEWNRRVEFTEVVTTNDAASHRAEADERVLVRVYLRNSTADHGLSTAQEPSVVPFLYFFGDDTMMDHLDHSKQDSRFDVLLAECWVPLPSTTTEAFRAAAADPTGSVEIPFDERICALYAPQVAASTAAAESAIEMVGQLRLALKWDLVNRDRAAQDADALRLYCQLEVARVCLSIVDDASSAATVVTGSAHQPREVLCISLSDQHASAGIQLSYGLTSGGKHVVNARVGHFQIDNQLLDTNYPVMLSPIRLVDEQQLHRGFDMSTGAGSSSTGSTSGRARDGSSGTGAGTSGSSSSTGGPMLLPTLQLTSVFSIKPTLVQFEYIFGQLQELEIKLEDSLLVALAQAFSGVKWPSSNTNSGSSSDTKPHEHTAVTSARSSNLALHLLEKDWSSRMAILSSNTSATLGGGSGANVKVLLRWLLLCPVKMNVTFTSTADRSLLLSLLSPDLYSVLSTLISAAAALVSNLDKAPIKIPEFYVENLLETTHTLAFYAMQHYVHHGLRSWYNIMGSVDFLGNPIGLVSTLGTGVKDFFYTPAQMLLEDEKGLRIDNLRTGMTKGSKSLLRNTAVGIFHTTGKITETLGKGIAMLAMDEQYNVQRQRQSSKQIKKINDLGDAIAEGGKGLAGGVWDGIKGVVAAPVRGAERDGASGFVFGIGKGFAGLIVKPTAGFLDLLTSLSRGAKTSAEAIDGADHDFDTVTRFRLPRRVCSDGVLVAYSEREATGNAILLLTALDATDEYVYHVYYGHEPLRGLVLLTDKRIVCLSATSGQRLWEVALDSTLQVEARGSAIELQQHASSSHRTLSVECDDAVAATNFRVAVDSARVDLSATRYLLLNLEKQQDEARNGGASGRAIDLARSEAERSDLHLLMENVQDTMVTGLTPQDLRAQPLRSVRVELCHLENKDAHAQVPARAIISSWTERMAAYALLSFTVFQIQVYGGPYQWTVFRRFSEFRDLLAALQAAGFATDALPALPPRTFLPSTRASVAKSRQDALSMLLQAAIMHSSISKSALTLEFLTREAQEVRISLPPLSPTGAATDHDASQRGEDSS